MKNFLNWRWRRRLGLLVAAVMAIVGALCVRVYSDNNRIVVEAADNIYSGALAAGTYTLTEDVYLGSTCYISSGTVTINGNGYTIYGPTSDTVIRVSSGSKLILNNVNVQYTRGDDVVSATDSWSMAIIVSGELQMTGGSVSNGRTQCIHGAAYSSSSITLNGVEVYGSKSLGIGSYGKVVATNCYFHNNSSQDIHLNNSGNASVAALEVYNCQFSGAYVGIYCINGFVGSDVKIYNSTFTQKTTAIKVVGSANGQSLYVSGNTITGGSSSGTGIYLEMTDFGACNLSNNVVSGCVVGAILHNDCALSGNSFYGNSAGVEICSGTATYSSGNTYNNSIQGININGGSLVFSGGSISGNGSCDIRHAGTALYISGSATCEGTKGIYLESGKTIAITSVLTCADGALPVTVATSDATVGRVVAATTYSATTAATSANLGKFSLTNDLTTTKSSTTLPNGENYRSAVLRQGNGTNSALGNIIISEVYYQSYQGSLDASGITYELPATQLIYWKEANSLTCGSATMYYNGGELRSFTHTGWNTAADATGSSYGVDATRTFTAEESTKDYVLYTTWSVSANLCLSGNGQTSGEDYEISPFTSLKATLPQNDFERVEEITFTSWDGVTCEESTSTQDWVYSFCGWSLSEAATYASDSLYAPGEVLDVESLLVGYLTSGQELTLTDGYIDLPIYAVWDAYPTLETTCLYLSESQLADGITAEELLAMGVVATDTEDGELEAEFVYFDLTDLLEAAGDLAFVDLRVVTSDALGQTASGTLRIYIVSDGLYKGSNVEENRAYVRLISQEYYETGSHEEGGFYSTSLWYNDASYATALEKAFANLEAGTFVYSYTFTLEDLRASKEYVTTHGPGNYTSADNLAGYVKLMFGGGSL